MNTTEICLLTRAAITRLLCRSDGEPDDNSENCQRDQPRWPFLFQCLLKIRNQIVNSLDTYG